MPTHSRDSPSPRLLDVVYIHFQEGTWPGAIIFRRLPGLTLTSISDFGSTR